METAPARVTLCAWKANSRLRKPDVHTNLQPRHLAVLEMATSAAALHSKEKQKIYPHHCPSLVLRRARSSMTKMPLRP